MSDSIDTAAMIAAIKADQEAAKARANEQLSVLSQLAAERQKALDTADELLDTTAELVLMLRDYYGVGDIAEALNCSTATVNTYVSRARKAANGGDEAAPAGEAPAADADADAKPAKKAKSE